MGDPPLPSIKLFYLTTSMYSAWVLPFGTQGQDLLRTPIADNNIIIITTNLS
jgi:hypothetical protein